MDTYKELLLAVEVCFTVSDAHRVSERLDKSFDADLITEKQYSQIYGLLVERRVLIKLILEKNA